MKPLVIYHADCTDGFGAAFAAWLKLGDDAEYLPMQYGNVPSSLPIDNREVYILDFSFPRDVMDGVFAAAKRVVWLDHHKMAFEMWLPDELEYDEWEDTTKNGLIRFDNNKSGALLAWEYFHPDTEVPMLIRHIDDRDRWIFALDGSKELHAALQSYRPWSFAQWNDYFFYGDLVTHDCGVSNFIAEGASILRAQDQHVASMAKQTRKCRIPTDLVHSESGDRWMACGFACNATLHISELGHILATQSGTYALIWYVAADNKVKCSLRSNGDYDVSAIAKVFGGGGHRNAAGFETDTDMLMGWLK